MQTVQLFDGQRDHGLTVTEVTATDGGGFDAVVMADGDDRPHRLSVQQDPAGFYRVSHGSSPQAHISFIDNEFASRMRITLADDGEDDEDDVRGHVAAPVLDLTGTVTDDDDGTGHLSIGQAASTVTLAASGAYMLFRQLASIPAAEHATNMTDRCYGC